MNSTNTQNNKNTGKKLMFTSNSQIYIGIFCTLGGLTLLINNYISLPPKIISILLFLFSAYLIILAILKQIQKVYYVLGLILFSIFVSIIIKEYGNSSIVWPVIMIVLSSGIIAYGYLFKREKHIRYTVPGIVLLGMGILVFFIVGGGDIPLEIILKLWPLLLILLGVYQIYLRYQIKKIQDEFHLTDEDDENEYEDTYSEDRYNFEKNTEEKANTSETEENNE